MYIRKYWVVLVKGVFILKIGLGGSNNLVIYDEVIRFFDFFFYLIGCVNDLFV